jgi:AcrR family transcriptional regulator
MPRPRSLTTDQLASAALAVTDRAGSAGLSMRTVAAELGISTMGLYRYVGDRAELERLVVDRVFDAVDTIPPPADLPWDERATVLADRVRVAFTDHPAVLALTLVHRHRSPGTIRWGEAVLAVLAEAGFSDRERLVAVRALFSYVVGALQLEHLGPLAGVGTQALADLPPGEFPHTTANAGSARLLSVDEEFGEGLRLLLRGMAPR